MVYAFYIEKANQYITIMKRQMALHCAYSAIAVDITGAQCTNTENIVYYVNRMIAKKNPIVDGGTGSSLNKSLDILCEDTMEL